VSGGKVDITFEHLHGASLIQFLQRDATLRRARYCHLPWQV